MGKDFFGFGEGSDRAVYGVGVGEKLSDYVGG